MMPQRDASWQQGFSFWRNYIPEQSEWIGYNGSFELKASFKIDE